jgi:IS1 family transposase/transposase-like protein
MIKLCEGDFIMVLVPLECLHCGSINIRKFGVSQAGKQRYECKDCKKTFQKDYTYNAYDPKIRSEIYFQTINGSGVSAIARNLRVAKDTVISILRDFESSLWYVNHSYIEKINSNDSIVEIVSATESEMDEMWSFVHDKSQQYWLWWAIDHCTGEPLAFCFGTREHKNLDELLKLLASFGITKVYADDNFAYKSKINAECLETGKRNTQKIERKHLSLRTWCSRLVRKGIRFSKKHDMHRIVIALVINFWFWGRVLV